MKLATLAQTATATAPRVIECRVADVELKSVEFNSVNLSGDKAVFVTFVYPDNSTEKLWCSKAVSAGLRDKSITMQNFGTLVIAKAYTADKQHAFWQLQMPGEQGANTVSVDATNIGTKPIERKKVAWTDLIELGTSN